MLLSLLHGFIDFLPLKSFEETIVEFWGVFKRLHQQHRCLLNG